MAMRNGTLERRAELLGEAVDFIEREYPRPLTIEDVARELATSRRQLQRVFADVGQTSFRELLASVRMERARMLLADPTIPVKAVAAAIGFDQPAQFAKSFRRHHGTSPSRYRASLLEDRRTLEQPRPRPIVVSLPRRTVEPAIELATAG